MPVRVNGGVFTDQVLTGQLKHYKITGANFSGAMDIQGRPIFGSAAERVLQEVSKRATVVIMNPEAGNGNGMSFALETNRSAWVDFTMQVAIRALGVIGIDNVDVSLIVVQQVPYDFNYVVGPYDFIGLSDTPSSYPVGSSGKPVLVNSTEDALIYGGFSFPATDGTPGQVLTTDGMGNLIFGTPITETTTASNIGIGAGIFNSIVGVDLQFKTLEAGPNITLTPTATSVIIESDPAPVGAEAEYINVIASSTLNANARYFISTNGTFSLPDTTTVTIGDSIRLAKAQPVIATIIVAGGNLNIVTDIGSDTDILYDITKTITFVYDGTNWVLEYGGQ